MVKVKLTALRVSKLMQSELESEERAKVWQASSKEGLDMKPDPSDRFSGIVRVERMLKPCKTKLICSAVKGQATNQNNVGSQAFCVFKVGNMDMKSCLTR